MRIPIAQFLATLAVAALAPGCIDRPMTVFERLQDARQLASEALVQFTKAADASNRALVAVTDDTAAAGAREAEESLTAVQAVVDRLKPLLEGLGYTNELQLIDEFTKRFADYRQMDRQILDLLIESSNLKAQRLSFGPVQQQADALSDALGGAAPRADSASRAGALAASIMSAVREIQALQAPHIAEASDARMSEIEKRMAAAEATARQSMAALGAAIPAADRVRLAAATAAFDQFMKLNAEVVALSRRNSNVHALALSLGQKRTLVAACEDSLRALQEALAKREFRATR